jgi:hypothetical protein
MGREMHLSVVAENEAVQLSMGIQEELRNGAARFLQAFRVNPMHDVTPIKRESVGGFVVQLRDIAWGAERCCLQRLAVLITRTVPAGSDHYIWPHQVGKLLCYRRRHLDNRSIAKHYAIRLSAWCCRDTCNRALNTELDETCPTQRWRNTHCVDWRRLVNDLLGRSVIRDLLRSHVACTVTKSCDSDRVAGMDNAYQLRAHVRREVDKRTVTQKKAVNLAFRVNDEAAHRSSCDNRLRLRCKGRWWRGYGWHRAGASTSDRRRNRHGVLSRRCLGGARDCDKAQ